MATAAHSVFVCTQVIIVTAPYYATSQFSILEGGLRVLHLDSCATGLVQLSNGMDPVRQWGGSLGWLHNRTSPVKQWDGSG